MSEPAVRHPIFARAFDRLCGLMERELAVQRRELLAGLTGRVLELGAGNGNNFEHYPATVDEVIAIEPEPYLRGKAHQAANRAPVPVTVREGVAEAARDTVGAVAAAGFAVERVRAFALGPTWMFVNPHVVGVARATPASAALSAA